MTAKNHSTVAGFILATLTHKQEVWLPLFILFLVICVASAVRNLGLILLIVLNSHLHTPMYYLISNLSFIDLCHSSVITPRMLISFLSETNTISYPECMIQLCFFHMFGIAECHMLAAMTYDRYVAICSPLLYNVIMSYQVFSFLVMGVYFLVIISTTMHTGSMQRLLFCKANVVNHYFCDLFPLLSFSCSSINETLILCFSAFNILVPTLSILSFYIFIINSILHIHPTEGRYKAVTTCSSHIVAVILSYGSAMFIYLQPSSVNSMDQRKVSSVFYTNILPLLNPLIYSLRNKDVKIALIKTLEKKGFS
ncbi:putative olfactory receptor 8G3 [Petaurus breviceps papuanus]|uniref:putative olfactory receptor 8G3 n=1 Tax=Petaurus breviceps papuanus TaxID=3040969 RepID=UPI0036DCEC03